jgi:hypothetical protein
MTTDTNGERRLLEEGVTSYVPAASAILAFRELIQSRFRQALEKRLEEYSAAVGIPLDRGQILDSQFPADDKWDGIYADLGVEMGSLGDTGSVLYHVLYWELGEDGTWMTGVGAAISVRIRAHVKKLRKAFLPYPANLSFWDETYEMWLVEAISPMEAGECEGKLNDILSQWFELWKRAGGLKVLSDESSSDE